MVIRGADFRQVKSEAAYSVVLSIRKAAMSATRSYSHRRSLLLEDPEDRVYPLFLLYERNKPVATFRLDFYPDLKTVKKQLPTLGGSQSDAPVLVQNCVCISPKCWGLGLSKKILIFSFRSARQVRARLLCSLLRQDDVRFRTFYQSADVVIIHRSKVKYFGRLSRANSALVAFRTKSSEKQFMKKLKIKNDVRERS